MPSWVFPGSIFEVVESALHEVGAVEDGLRYLVDTFRVVGWAVAVENIVALVSPQDVIDFEPHNNCRVFSFQVLDMAVEKATVRANIHRPQKNSLDCSDAGPLHYRQCEVFSREDRSTLSPLQNNSSSQ